MAKLNRKNGATSNILRVKLLDSSVTTGAGKTGLTSASSGLIISTIADNEATATTYTAAGSTTETITTLGTFAAPTATKCRFKEVDATNHPGLYEIQIADARFAVSSAKALIVSISGVSGVAQVDLEIDLAGQVDTVSISGTAQTARDLGASVLLSTGTGTGQLDFTSGVVKANTTQVSGTAQTARDLGASVLLSSGTGTGQLDFTSGVVKSNLAQILGTVLTETSGLLAAAFKKFFNVATPTGTVNSLPDAVAGAAGGVFIAGTNAPTTVTTSFTTTFTGSLTGNVNGNVGGNVTGSVGSVATGGITTASFFAGATIPRCTLTDTITTYTGNTVQTGDAYARLGAPVGASISADINSATSLAQTISNAVVLRSSTSASGGATSIVLDSGASSVDSAYVGHVIVQQNQARVITAYVGSTKTATVDRAWANNPSTTTYYLISTQAAALGTSAAVVLVNTCTTVTNQVTAAANADAVWDEIMSGHTVSGSYGEKASDWASQTTLLESAGDIDTIYSNVITTMGQNTTIMTESYATDGSAMTPNQALHMIWSAVSQFDISSTTITARKLNGTTAAMTFTMDDATNPTSRTRAT